MSSTRRHVLQSGGEILAGVSMTAAVTGAVDRDRPAIPDSQIIGDYAVDPIVTIEYDDETAAVCRYRNIAGAYANGIEVVVNQERLLDEAAATPRLTDGSWIQAVDTIRGPDGSGLRDEVEQLADVILDQTQTIEALLDTPEAVLRSVVEGIDTLKETGVTVGGQSITVWSIATRKFPFLRTFDTIVRELQQRVSDWYAVASQTNADVPPYLSALEELPPPRHPPSDRFRGRAKEALQALAELAEQTEGLIAEIDSTREEAVSVVQESTQMPLEIINEIESITEVSVPDSVEQQIQTFTNELVELTESVTERVVEPVRSPLQSFYDLIIRTREELDIESTATNIYERFSEGWNRRRDSEEEVIAGGAVSTAGFALLLLLGWMPAFATEEGTSDE